MKVIRVFNAQPVKLPHFNNPLTRKQAGDSIFCCIFFNVHYVVNVNYVKFQKKFDSRTISREFTLSLSELRILKRNFWGEIPETPSTTGFTYVKVCLH